ncbi:M23 family metallopeptidase [Burkholderia ambifaria]|uniref:M23 family metallopeptidase n=1 Tax=Burkholderia ambifaria TaxID=152480 RepID=UPI001E55D96D|nr:M23 family metallopeptidase [Burkholderia ambifaria]UEP25230.1 M23 family metallopeptidase [Burkholderia ambifaria]
MIISPPFLPTAGLTSSDATVTDPMMDAVDKFELSHHGLYPIGFDRRWHCGVHLVPNDLYEPVRAIADGEVVAYRVSQKAISDGQLDAQGKQVANCNNGFVLLKHSTDTGDGRTITFYSLYMHLLDIATLAQDRPRMGKAPADSSPMELAKWLEIDTGGVQAGQGKKVYRKDILGYMGRNHGHSHLHLEIFMTEEDFSAWFEQQGHAIQPGERHPVQPTSTDYWGHTYFVIPGGTTFAATPPRQADSPYFPPQSAGTLGATSSLYVEAWFHKGQRYVRAWIDPDGNGKRTLLTPEPVRDPCEDYEYNLYQRATDLYKACPSDGYELLRFGRILSTDSPTLPEASRATYVAVPFDAAGTLGYVDVNQRAVRKLSDADFPSFMGWRKVDNLNAPLDAAGLWDIDKFREMIGDTTKLYLSERSPEFGPDDELAAYMRGSDEARAALKGFICHAVSEWDPANNGLRYSGLSASDGFFGRRAETDPDGYGKFLGFLSKLQFLDQTSLGGGKKLWFFHPLSFIRHFRKCGWLSVNEIAQCVPRKIIDQTKNGVSQTIYPTSIMSWDKVASRALRFADFLNPAMRAYGICSSGLRTAYFFGNAIQETTYLSRTTEVGGENARYAPWYGRGVIQLTHEENYKRYGDFRAWSDAPSTYRNSLETDLSRACDSAGFYWVSCAKPIPKNHNINIEADKLPEFVAIRLQNVCSGYNYRTKSCRVPLSSMEFRESVEFERCARAVNTGNPNSKGVLHGLVPRMNVFLSSISVLTDILIDYESARLQREK